MSRKICDLYRNCCSGNEGSVRTFLSSQPLPLVPCNDHHLPSEAVPDDRDDKMEEGGEGSGDGDKVEVVMEEEGEGEREEGEWEVVRKSRRRSKK